MTKFIFILLLSLGVFAQESSMTEEDTKENEVGPCDRVQEIANHIANEEWKNVVHYMSFPIERDFPFEPLNKQAFLKNPTLVFEKNMFQGNISVKLKREKCMVNKGMIWTETLSLGNKILAINYETPESKSQRLNTTKKQLKLLPKDWKESKVMLSCDFSGNQYHVYKNIENGNYLLLVSNKDKVKESVPDGSFRRDETGIRYFRFNQEGTQLTLADNIREGGYYLNLKVKSGAEKFYKCLKPNT